MVIQRRELLLLVVGILIGALAGLVAGYGVHELPAQGSVGSVQSAGDGFFLINGQKMDLGALQMMLQIDRTKVLDESIADQMDQIQERNKLLKNYTEELAGLRKQLAGLDREDDEDAYHSLEIQIENLKGKIDALNSDSQLDMIRLQSLIDKRNQAFEMASNTLQRDQKTRDSITGNFR